MVGNLLILLVDRKNKKNRLENLSGLGVGPAGLEPATS